MQPNIWSHDPAIHFLHNIFPPKGVPMHLAVWDQLQLKVQQFSYLSYIVIG